MAGTNGTNDRQFTLVGNFTDNISGQLVKINDALDGVLRKLEGFTSKYTELTNSVRSLGSAAQATALDIKDQGKAFSEAAGSVNDYVKSIGAANRLNSRGGLRFLNNIEANKRKAGVSKAKEEGARLVAGARAASIAEQSAAKAAKDLAKAEQTATRTAAIANRIGGYGGGGGGPRPPRGGGGYGGGYGGGFNPTAGQAFAFTLGNTLSGFMTNAIVGGFQIGVGLMAKPFEYVAGAFKERVADELSDIQAAGGLYVTDIRKNLGLFKNFGEALRLQEELNARLAKSAQSLPGETAEYVRQAKRLEDTFAKALGQDPAKFTKFGESLGAKVGDKLDAFQVVVQKFTEKAVLLSQGTRGAAGTSGVYGLPQLLEILINRDKVNVQALETKYASLRDNPLLASALKDAEDTLAKTGAGSADRIAEVFKVLEQALPNEVIQRIRQSTASIFETIRSTFLDPETGLFGLGRKLEVTVPRVDEFGRYLTKFGTVTNNASLAAQDTISLFQLFRDILSGFALPLISLSDILFAIYNPLEAIGVDLVRFRNIAQNFYKSFNAYTKDFEILGKQLNSVNIGRTASQRGALLAIANLLRFFKVIEKSDFAAYVNKLKDPRANLKNITTELFGKLFDSEFMRQVGETIGKVVGGALQAVAGFLSGTSNFVTSSKFATGFVEGFDSRKGLQAVETIFKSLIDLFFDAIKSIFKVTPLSVKLLAGLALFIPAITAAIGAALVNGVQGVMARCFAGGKLDGAACAAAGGSGGGSGRKRGAYRYGPGGSIDRLNRRRRATIARRANLLGSAVQLTGLPGSTTLPAVGKAISKRIPGGALAAGALTAASGIASGESSTRVFAQTAGAIIGGTIGTFAGPWGTVIGSTLGPLVADKIVDAFDKPSTALERAAAAMEAVDKGAEKYGEQYAALGTLDAALGGGSGIQKYAEEQLKLGAISAKQAQAYKVLGQQLTTTNVNFDKYQVAEKDYLTAKKLAGGKETKLVLELKGKRDKAEKDYLGAVNKAQKEWEGMSTKMQGGLLVASKALESFAARVNGIRLPSELARTRENPNPGKKPSLLPDLSDPNQATIDRRKGIAILQKKYKDKGKPIGTVEAAAKYDAGERYKGSLGDAVSSELRNKPSGSKLLIANSSETIIPAAGGNGVGALINTFRTGLISIATSLKEINATLKLNQQQTNARLMKIETKFTAAGGPLGGSIGGAGAFGSIASRYGLTMTSGYRPGDPGYHGIDRARDYSNSTGPTPQMMAFAQFLATTYGRNLKELIYTPLGYSIKNGQRVAPYAQGQHYNHVHVAYGLGYPTAFSSLNGARAFEKAVTPGSVKIASVTGRSDEGFGSSTNIRDINVTVNAGGVQNHDELASIVVQKIQNAIYTVGNSYTA